MTLYLSSPFEVMKTKIISAIQQTTSAIWSKLSKLVTGKTSISLLSMQSNIVVCLVVEPKPRVQFGSV